MLSDLSHSEGWWVYPENSIFSKFAKGWEYMCVFSSPKLNFKYCIIFQPFNFFSKALDNPMSSDTESD